MTDFEHILTDSLDQIASGEATPEEIMLRNPEHAGRLKPLLRTAARLQRGNAVRLTPAAKARGRAKLTSYTHAHPRRKRAPTGPWRATVSLAALVVAFLMAGTAFAQSALPGDALYSWKRTSERVWHTVSLDRVGTDLAISERRASELSRLNADPDRSPRAREDYQRALQDLNDSADPDAQTRIYKSLQGQQELLKNAGISLPELDDFISRIPDAAPK
ncbi:MAG TPA: hypothetical protein VGJ22_11605 [Anaerolineales bacterium]